MHLRKGFTLIELLVVIAIIALLMAILMPALARVRQQAESVTCQATLKQWCIIWYNYCDDNEGFFQRDLDWIEPLRRYVQNDKLYLCVSAQETMAEGGRHPFAAWEDVAEGITSSYGINQWINNFNVEEGGRKPENLWKTMNVRGGENAPIMGDCGEDGATAQHCDGPPEFDGQIYLHEPQDEDEIRNFCVNRHNGAMNMAFINFSVRRVGLKELWELDWSRDWNPVNQPPPDWPNWMRNMKDYH